MKGGLRELQASQTACPQCGAVVAVPHQVDTFRCSSCRSTLRVGEGLRVHRLFERPRVPPEAAAGLLRAWFAGPAGPADLEQSARYEIGSLECLHFVRVRRAGRDRVIPVAGLPTPELRELGNVSASLEPESDAPAEATAASACAPDPDLLSQAFIEASADPESLELLVERRSYYPVRYSYQGEWFTAAIDAGSGRIVSGRRPARKEVLGERQVAAGTLALLFAEAVLVPGLVAKLVVVGASTLGLYPLLRWAVEQHG